MNSSTEHSLAGFEQRLLSELKELILLQAGSDVPIAREQSRATRSEVQRRPLRGLRRAGNARARRALAAFSCAVVAGGVAMLMTLSSSTPDLARAFPLFAKPAMDANPELSGLMRTAAGVRLRDAHADVRNARAIRTPLGTGYVLSDIRASQVCLVIPDGHRAWGAACGSIRSAQRHGAGGLMVADAGRAEFVEVLPTGATAQILGRHGKMTQLALKDGVLAVLVHHRTTITTRVGRNSSTATFAPAGQCDPTANGGCPSA